MMPRKTSKVYFLLSETHACVLSWMYLLFFIHVRGPYTVIISYCILRTQINENYM